MRSNIRIHISPAVVALAAFFVALAALFVALGDPSQAVKVDKGLSGLERVEGTPVGYASGPAFGLRKATVSCPSGKHIISVDVGSRTIEEGTAPPYVVGSGFGDDLTGGSMVMSKPDTGSYGFSASGLCAYASVEDGP